MSLAELHVAGALPGTLSLDFRVGGETSGRVETHIDDSLEALIDAPTSHLQAVLVGSVWRSIRQWVLDSPDDRILVIRSDSAALDAIPWERCLAGSLPTVVRLVHGQPAVLQPAGTRHRLRILAAGWPSVPGMQLPGIASELSALADLALKTNAEVRVLSDPTVEELREAWSSFAPQILHLIPPAVRSPSGAAPQLLMAKGGQHHWVDVADLVPPSGNGRQSVTASTQLVVINSCDSGGGHLGPSALRVIADAIQSSAFGWLGKIDDQAAADFAPFFFNRLLEGVSIVSALRAYRATGRAIGNGPPQEPIPQETHGSSHTRFATPPHPAAPVLWSSNIELVTRPLLAPVAGETPRTQADGSLSGSRGDAADSAAEKPGAPQIEIILEPMRFLNPALLKNGRPAIRRLVLDARDAQQGVCLAIHCDTGLGISTFRQTLDLEKGRQPFTPIDRVQFPVLYQLIDAAIDRRQINFTVTCTCDGRVISEKTQSVLWMGCDEWLDDSASWPYIPAFVDPYEDGVLDVLDKADEVLKSLESAISSFSGYQQANPAFVTRQVEAIFKALRDKPFELRYINPPPIPVFAPNSALPTGQRVRTPTQVIERRRGTCHDLALLFASCLEHIGIYPLVILTSGHTFVGFWTNSDKHSSWWHDVRKDPLTTATTGALWTIARIDDLQALFDRGDILLLETTSVTDRNADFTTALQAGGDNITGLTSPSQFDAAIDIQASRMQIQPL